MLDTEGTVEVPVTTLDRFCAEHSLRHIDILKLDVQGAEYATLTGARRLLDEQAIDIVYMLWSTGIRSALLAGTSIAHEALV